MVTYNTYDTDTSSDFMVFLELARRSAGDITETSFQTNRIGLFVNDVNISTNKTIPAIQIPFSGTITGESKTIAVDLGMAQKTISLTGTILEQTITKQNTENSSSSISKTLTALEISQLIHSYVDSSFIQEDQNLKKLVIFIPSRVDTNFEYHDNVDSTTDIRNLPLVPFSWANRAYDRKQTILASDFPKILSDSSMELSGVSGFIRSFQTTITGANFPAVEFTLEFEQSSTLISDAISNII